MSTTVHPTTSTGKPKLLDQVRSALRVRHYSYRNVGGKWNREEGFWELPYFHVVNLGLEDRVYFDENG